MSYSRRIPVPQVLERRPPRGLGVGVPDDDPETEGALVGLLAALSVPGVIDAGLAAVVSAHARSLRAHLGESRVLRGSAFDGRVTVVEGVSLAPVTGRPGCT